MMGMTSKFLHLKALMLLKRLGLIFTLTSLSLIACTKEVESPDTPVETQEEVPMSAIPADDNQPTIVADDLESPELTELNGDEIPTTADSPELVEEQLSEEAILPEAVMEDNIDNSDDAVANNEPTG